MKIIVTTPTSQDYKKFSSAGMNAEACLADRVKLICQDDAGHVAESFMKQDEFDRLGLALHRTERKAGALCGLR